MHETFELRVVGKHADHVFGPTEGQSLAGGFIRKITLDARDPRVRDIARWQATLDAAGAAFFHGWTIRRRYSRSELDAADLFHVIIDRAFEPAGEEGGTRYDDARACQLCGAGAPRLTPLFLKMQSIPKGDISRTIADEIVVSTAVKSAFESAGIRGAVFRSVYEAGSSRPVVSHWEMSAPTQVPLHHQTRIEDSLFAGRNLHACPRGDRVGANITSEVFVQAPLPDSADVMVTKEFLGFRRGLLRPAPLLLVRKTVRDLIIENKFKGFKFEIAHVVD